MSNQYLLAIALLIAVCAAAPVAQAAELSVQPRQQVFYDLLVDGQPCLRTMITPPDPADREETYKVYTHIFDFAGAASITKGPGGLYTHHRGLFIGWKTTTVEGKDYDTWHMKDGVSQRHVAWNDPEFGKNFARQSEEIEWYETEGKPFIRETRTIRVDLSNEKMRVFDFGSRLVSQQGTIELRGDLQHAGMQLRLANEVSEHQDSTQYILPVGAKELDDDKVVGGWWACCSAVVGGKRYWALHMTPSDHPTGEPVYSIRRYARFGSFFEPTLEEGKPLDLHFRIVISEEELDQAACAKLYDAYNGGRK